MSLRDGSPCLLRAVTPKAPLAARDAPAPSPDAHAAEWRGRVVLDHERAAMASAPRFHAQVRAGLLERTMSLGADYAAGPHRGRPEAARRFVAHVDALAEAGLCAEEIASFAAERDVEDAGTPWALTLLFGCLDVTGAEVCFEAWASALDPSAPEAYAAVVAIARALGEAPSPSFYGISKRLVTSPSAVLRAVALECLPLADLSDAELAAAVSIDAPIVWTALDRLLARQPRDPSRRLPARPPWTDLGCVQLAFEAARARAVSGDLAPISAIRARDARALSALGPLALDLVALACDPADPELPLVIARGAQTTPRTLSVLGRIGLPVLFPRLLAALQEEDFEDEAHAALVTALGPGVDEPSVLGWEQAASRAFGGARLRAGSAFSPAAIVQDLGRPEHSCADVEARAAELRLATGRSIDLSWSAFGTSLEAAIGALSSLVR